jgi:D-amino-acid N-acetyltransferase
MSATIRPVTKQDEAAWRRHWQSYNDFYKRTISETVTATTFSRFLDPSTQIYCAVAETSPADAKSDAAIIGFVTWFPHPSTSRVGPVVYLNDLFVDPSIRSKGVGGELMEHVFAHSKRELGAESVYWLTQHFNHRAQLLYVKKGFKSDFVHYTKSLADV